MRRYFWVLWLILAAPLSADNRAADLDARIRTAGLDADECYRVRELTLVKEDIRLYFTEGYLILGKPVDGQRHTALFSGEVEGGDGEILVMPPTRSERLSLATFTDAPNLSEHFRFALMIFSDDTADALMKEIRKQPILRPSPERGMLLADQWNSVTINLARSFGTRLVYDRVSERPQSEGFFYGAIRGNVHGNFDIVYDPVAGEQIQVGQVRFRNNQAFFDTWTSFRSRSFRNGTRTEVGSGFQLTDFRIEATLTDDLVLEATTAGVLTVEDEPRQIMYFDISPQMSVSEVLVDGEQCAIWQREALRANLFSGGSGLFLVIAPKLLEPGRHSIQFRHQGRVVAEAGNGVYYVGSRSTWHPRHGLEFSHFDTTFRYPEGLNLIFSGEVVEDRTEDNWHITRRKTDNPIRLIGFNVGQYAGVRTERDSYAIEVFANTEVEEALEPDRRVLMVPQHPSYPGRTRTGRGMIVVPIESEAPNPTERLGLLAEEVADAFEFMREHFGEPPTSSLMVSPIPGNFGQGFPGLLYLSTISYLDPKDRPASSTGGYRDLFYSEIIHAHETAHQWWGNTVAADGYQDGWLMEALANYSALLLIERRKGPETVAAILDQYRQNLLAKNSEGKTLESAGPISWGPRLDSSQAFAYRVITYEKGSWIAHMLRRRLGDERFLEMLGELCRQYRYKMLTTEAFRDHAAAYLPDDFSDRTLEGFFDQWVYDTGIPDLKFTHRVRGNAPKVRVTGTVTQSGVPDYFSTLVPVRFELPGGESVTRWLQTSDEPASFDVTLPQRPVKVIFNPGDSALTLRR